MGDVLLARQPTLIGVVVAGVDKRLLDPLAIDRGGGMVGVFLDDREQVAEQLLLGLGQLRVVDGDRLGGVGQEIDRRPTIVLGGLRFRRRDRRDRRRRRGIRRDRLPGLGVGAPGSARMSSLTTAEGRGQPLGGGFALLRNRFPSSYRLA
jgi:hypothetical protein